MSQNMPENMPEKVSSKAYEKPGTLLKPGPTGRVLRLLVGGLQVAATILVLLYSSWFLRPETITSGGFIVALLPGIQDIPDLTSFQVFIQIFALIYIGISFVISLRWLPHMVNIAFRVTWGGRLYWVLLGLVAITIPLSLALFGTFWALPFSLLVFLTILYTTGHLGISLILAAILATPGCEMRSIPHLIGIVTGRKAEEHSCPGMWTGIDEREARKRAQPTG